MIFLLFAFFFYKLLGDFLFVLLILRIFLFYVSDILFSFYIYLDLNMSSFFVIIVFIVSFGIGMRFLESCFV